MKQTRLTHQQKQWIVDAYQSIAEDPAAFGYESLEGHLDEIVTVIKEDVDQVFCSEIIKENIINLIKSIKYE